MFPNVTLRALREVKALTINDHDHMPVYILITEPGHMVFFGTHQVLTLKNTVGYSL